VRIRAAEPDDAGLLFTMIVALADYERAADQVVGSEELLADALFGDDPSAEAVIAEVDGMAAGFALFYRTFSTWTSRPGIWLEDLFVYPEHRRAGIGAALLEHLAGLALDRGYTRLEWSALEWNSPALAFYAGLGAERLEEWRVLRLDGEALRRVGGGSTSPSAPAR
jgi:GNAT superfamily N-acetyltransferase